MPGLRSLTAVLERADPKVVSNTLAGISTADRAWAVAAGVARKPGTHTAMSEIARRAQGILPALCAEDLIAGRIPPLNPGRHVVFDALRLAHTNHLAVQRAKNPAPLSR